jgi:tetratricopeptide (TPR) repeat protein
MAGTLLLFGFLRRATGALWRSAFVAALFALHPLHVESVAWVSERKDVLSTAFWMAALWAYAWYVERPRWNRYLLVLLAFVLGLMAKSMLVTLPGTLLLLDLWPLRRWTLRTVPDGAQRRPFAFLVLEKVPLCVVSLGAAVLAVVTGQRSGALADTIAVPIGLRVENALVAYMSYIGKLLWPARLEYFYPYPGSVSPWRVAAAVVVVSGLSLAAVWARRSYLYVSGGWLWFLGTLLPVIGLVQAGDQSMADRYSYVSFIGLFVIIAWGVPDLLQRWRYRDRMLAIGASAVIAAMMVLAWKQVGYWRNGWTLAAHALAVDPDNFLAHVNMGMAAERDGQLADAMAHYMASLRLNPDRPEAHNDLGVLLARQGKMDEALVQYQAALRAEPNHVAAHANLGAALAAQNRLAEAIAEYREALRLDPEFAPAHYNLGVAWARQGNAAEAIKSFTEATRLQPDDAAAYYNLGIALAYAGNVREAIVAYREALSARPGWALPAEKLAELARQGLEP